MYIYTPYICIYLQMCIMYEYMQTCLYAPIDFNMHKNSSNR